MKKLVPTLAALTLAVGVFQVAPAVAEEEAPAHRYVGVQACGMCHKKESTGDQLGQWQASKHAQAYEVLATDAAKAFVPAGTDPQKNATCLECHTTQVTAADTVAPRPGKEGFVVEHGVQCETCHGPGSEYKSRKIMKDQAAAVAAGLVIPTRELCITCHNDRSPTYQGFDFDAAWAKVSHPNPKAAE